MNQDAYEAVKMYSGAWMVAEPKEGMPNHAKGELVGMAFQSGEPSILFPSEQHALDFAHMLSMARRDRESAVSAPEPIKAILQRRKWSLVWMPARDLMDDGWGCNYPNGTSVCEAAGRFPTPEDAVRQTEAWWVKYREGK